MKGRWNGQTKAEFDKNYKRVKDIFEKSSGDIEKAKILSITQANRITDEYKSLNRAMSAKELSCSNTNDQKVYDAIYDVFFHRAYELGSVSKQNYREYQLEKLGL